MLSEQPEFETPPPRSRTPWVAGGIVLVAAGLLILAVRGGGGMLELPRGDEHPAVGKQLTRLSLEPLTGSPPALSLDDLQGHVTLINFWGPWCQPCVMEFPHLKELVQHFGERRDFRFVSVSCANDEADNDSLAAETQWFLKQQRADFPTYSDPSAKTRRRLIDVAGEFAFPTTLIIGRDGGIRAMWVGYGPGLERQMREVLETAVAENPAAAASDKSSSVGPLESSPPAGVNP
jgi:thiol-disulfide isomerase/thioredoxin